MPSLMISYPLRQRPQERQNMKSIEDTLNLVGKIINEVSKETPFYIALAGGYSVIAHGVGRTTVDADFYIYSELVKEGGTEILVNIFKKYLPENFEVRAVEGTRLRDDPFGHDVVFLEDKSGQYPKMDFIIAKYKWELEGIKEAKPLEDIPFPVIPKPYLIAMKLKAGGLKDDYDIVELYQLLSEEERIKTHKLARLIKRDKKLKRLIKVKD
jgi:hypothetical protein